MHLVHNCDLTLDGARHKSELWLRPKKDWHALGDCSGCFEEQSAEKQHALQVLGTDPACWDSPAAMNGVVCARSHDMDKLGFYNTSTLTTTTTTTSTSSTSVHTSTSTTTTSSTTATTTTTSRIVLTRILVTNATGTTPPVQMSTTPWSRPSHVECVAGMYNTSSKRWKDLSSAQRAAAKTCGLSEHHWDGPSHCMRCFGSLADEEKEAVRAYGYSSSCYDYVVGCTEPSSNTSRNFAECPARVDMPAWTRRLVHSCDERGDDGHKPDLWLRPMKNWHALGDCSGCFADQSAEQQLALEILGTDESCWNAPARQNGAECATVVPPRRNSSSQKLTVETASAGHAFESKAEVLSDSSVALRGASDALTRLGMLRSFLPLACIAVASAALVVLRWNGPLPAFFGALRRRATLVELSGSAGARRRGSLGEGTAGEVMMAHSRVRYLSVPAEEC
eukprot:TRINITY_DN25203_c0_g1_i2.p1 TRINITY_DN25203_c0_g1~~TRINITY_DN25203_c0_g1_i2.p1  ORF type:complete len:450 (+),score=30.84 TRINITY_DN25203_c0_g1_i2:142-1491(+)